MSQRRVVLQAFLFTLACIGAALACWWWFTRHVAAPAMRQVPAEARRSPDAPDEALAGELDAASSREHVADTLAGPLFNVRVRCADGGRVIAGARVSDDEREYLSGADGVATVAVEPESAFAREWRDSGVAIDVRANGYLPRTVTVEAGAQLVDIELLRGVELTATVVDALQRTPIAGASVRVTQAWPPDGNLLERRVANETGELDATLVRPDIQVALTVSAVGYAENSTLVTLDAPRAIVLELGGPGVVRGLVRDPSGVPTAAVAVAAYSDQGWRDVIAQAGTDAEGRFEIRGLRQPGAYYLDASKRHVELNGEYRDLHWHARSSPFALAPGAATPWIALDLAGPNTVIEVDVVDQAGAALRRAWVEAQGQSPRDRPPSLVGATRSSSSGLTDEHGRCRLVLEDGGEFELRAGSPGHAADAVFLRVARGETGRALIRMQRGIPLAGCVVDAQGHFVTDLEMESTSSSPRGTRRSRAKTGVFGRFRFDDLFAGTVRLKTWRDAGLPCTQQLTYELGPFEAGDEQLRIVLPAPARLRLRLEPLPSDPQVHGEFRFENDASPRNNDWDAELDATGAIELCVMARSGWTTCIVECDDEPSFALAPLALEPGVLFDLGTVHRPRGSAFAGTVLGPTGEPLAGADVIVSAANTNWSDYQTTKADGRFRFDTLLHEPGSVSVEAEGCLDLEIELPDLAAVGALDVQLQRCPTLRVNLRIASRDFVGSPTVCVAEYEPGRAYYGSACQRAHVDGTCQFDVQPGRYKLFATPFGAEELIEGPEVVLTEGDVEIDWEL